MSEEQQQQNEAPSLQEAISNSGLLSEKPKEVTPSSFKAYGSTLKPLRTYQGDVDEIVGKTKTSLVSIVVAEQKKKYESPTEVLDDEEKPTGEVRNKIFLIMGSILLILGITAIGIVYYLNSQNSAIISANKGAILSYTEKFDIPLASTTRTQLIIIIKTKNNDLNFTVNSILYLNPTIGNTSASKNKIFALLSPSMPAPLLRSLNDQYMLGVFSFDKNEPFIIMKTDDYGASFAGMLKWEETMVSDLGGIFNITQPNGTTTPFEDEAIRNKDLRVVKDENNKTVLLYSFIDKNTIVITGTENIFNAIVSKYVTNQMIR